MNIQNNAGIVEASLGGVFECLYDDHLTLLYADESLFQLLDYSQEEFLDLYQNHLMDVICMVERDDILNEINKQLKKGHTFMYENRLVCKNGEYKWIWISAQLLKDSQNRKYFHCIFHDITEDKIIQENLAISEKRFQIIMEQTQDVIFEMDVRNNQVYYSENYEKTFGYKVPLDNFPASMFATDIIYEDDKTVLLNAFQSLRNGENSMQCEYRLKYRNKGYHWVEAKATAIRDSEGTLLNMIGIITDIHERKQEIIESLKEASYDPLTGLYNRRGFLKKIDELLLRNQTCVLILLDLDDFKNINDNLGHLEGDRVLYELSQNLKTAFEDQTIGRYGGDEFIIFVTQNVSLDELNERIKKFQDLIHQRFLDKYHIDLGFSIGASIYPFHGDNFLSLFHKADVAMYEAKKNGKNQFVVYENDHHFHFLTHRGYEKLEYDTKLIDDVSNKNYESKENIDFFQQLKHKEFVYQTALQKSHMNVWEYNLKQKRLYLTEGISKKNSLNIVEYQTPESMIEQGVIHPMSIPIVRDMYQEIEKGIPEIQADILTRGIDNEHWWWQRIHYHMIYDEYGHPCIAIAVGKDVTKQKETQMEYQKDLFYQVIQNKDLIAYFDCNITKNQIDQFHSIDVKYENLLTYDDILELQKQFSATQEDILRVQNIFSKEALMEAYSHGENILTCDYRRKDTQGHLSWVRAISKIFLDGNDLHILGVLQDIMMNKVLEGKIHKNIEKDPLTGIYSRDTVAAMIEQILSEQLQDHKPFAFLLFHVDLNHFVLNNQNNINGVLKEIASYLLLCFSKNKVVGKLYTGEFVVFIYNDFDRESILRYVNEIKQSMRIYSIVPGIQDRISIMFGATIDYTSKTFDELYNKTKKSMRDISENTHIEGLEIMINDDEQNVLRAKNELDLSTFTNYLYSLPFPINIQEALGEIRKFYDGDRAFLYDISQDCFVENKKESLAYLKYKECLLIHIDKIKQWAIEYKVDNLLSIEQLKTLLYSQLYTEDEYPAIMIPLFENNELSALLSVSGIKKNQEQISFLKAILLTIIREQRLFIAQKKIEYYQEFDSLTKVKNRMSFFHYSRNLNIDTLISLGIMVIDINGLRELNKIYGLAYGDSVIVRLANELGKEKEYANVYRFDSDEFLLVFENITYESFIKKTISIKQNISSICQVTVGVSWAEKQISLFNLVNNAIEQRNMEKQLSYGELFMFHENDGNKQYAYKHLIDAIQKGYLKMFLQQKVNSANGHVVGAEALIRYQDEKHGLVGPVQFVPYLETTGLIFYVDFLIFEEVHKLLTLWKQKGIPLIPISLNFSRVTLLSDELVDYMNQIHKKYDIDTQLIEIEITENIGEIERMTIIKQCHEIKMAGYRLALDDFGSKYSNISILSDIHFDTLKFDKQLIDYLIENKKSQWTLECIIDLCRKMDIYNVAEGVELKEQVDILAQMGCTYIQGYYYSKPVIASQFDISHNYRED